jgi:hypothetical protein
MLNDCLLIPNFEQSKHYKPTFTLGQIFRAQMCLNLTNSFVYRLKQGSQTRGRVMWLCGPRHHEKL